MTLNLVEKICFPTDLLFGNDTEFRLKLPKENLLLVVSASLNKDFLNAFVSSYESKGYIFGNIVEVSGEPSSDKIDTVFDAIFDKTYKLSGIVGFGGGSTLDFAKGLAVLFHNGGLISDFEFGVRKISSSVPLWLIPTTCGSGSEVTQYSVINNSRTGRKFTLAHESLRAKQAAVNPELIRFIPNQVRLETALDAFTHCLEALLNCDREKNSEIISRQGLLIASKSLPMLKAGELDHKLMRELCMLSVYGGISISFNRTGLIHTLSVAFSPFMDMSHGLLNAKLVEYALRYSLSSYNGRLREIVDEMFGCDSRTDSEAFQTLIDWLMDLVGDKKFELKKPIVGHAEDIFKRVLQDSGLNVVTHGGIDKQSLYTLIEGIIDEI
tara:strand:- start:2802 stop:3947 length:1146 start_codon:yes stop_codon:yes gene_type:complete